jgi:hypothetical protein
MSYRQMPRLTAIFVLMLPFYVLYVHSAASQSTLERLAINGYDPDRSGQPASDLISLAPDRFAVVDQVRHRFDFVDDSGRPSGNSIEMPPAFKLSRVVNYVKTVELVDVEDNKKIVWPRTIALGSSSPNAAIVQDIPLSDPSKLEATFVRHTPARVSSKITDAAGTAINLMVRALGPGYMMSVVNLGQDAEGRQYTLAREVHMEGGKISVRETAGRHGPEGRRTDVADIPVSCFAKVPTGAYVTPTPDGKIAYLLTLEYHQKRKLNLVLSEMHSEPPGRGSVQFDCSDHSLSAQSIDRVNVDDDFADTKDTPRVASKGARPAGPSPTLKAMWTLITQYAAVKFRVDSANFGAPSDENCAGPEAGFTRPRSINASMMGQVVTLPMPYGWGNNDSPEEFVRRVNSESPPLIGNICTKGDGLRDRTAGTDCSGFVSHVWSVEPTTTAGLQSDSGQIDGLDQMRFGDIYNKPNDHARIHLQSISNKVVGGMIQTAESTTACEGICIRNLQIDQFDGFFLRRRLGQ